MKIVTIMMNMSLISGQIDIPKNQIFELRRANLLLIRLFYYRHISRLEPQMA